MDQVTNKSYRSYDYISRYTAFPYYYNKADQKYIYGTTAQLDQGTAYTLYKVKAIDTYDSIALEFYNSPTFYWIICDFNQVQDSFSKPQEGSYLKIPSMASIKFN